MADPLPTPPAGGGDLRASDADRDSVATVLGAAFAEGRITREEHDERLDRVMAARTFADLVPVTADLVPLPQPAPPGPVRERAYAVEPASDATETIVAVFGGATRRGRWRVRPRTRVWAAFGGVDLDLSEAVFEGRRVEIVGCWVFGGLDLRLPPGVAVEDRVVGIFGGSEVKHLGDAQPGAPTVVVKGFALFGGVTVSGPRRRR